jgi:hypothetical protein
MLASARTLRVPLRGICLAPLGSCTVRISVPASRRWVAKLCRKVWGVAGFVIRACWEAALIAHSQNGANLLEQLWLGRARGGRLRLIAGGRRMG